MVMFSSDLMKADIATATSLDQVMIIILTYNQKDKTLECLTSLLSANEMPFKILVWDNDSHDGTIDAVDQAFPDVSTHHSESNLGVAGGRNAAAQLAIDKYGATYLLFLHNDILVEPGFVQALYEQFKSD